tara:strand:+ start:1113 stop:1616 length:504 start_codon:yes stop_codon:yes gene_type:complete
MPKLQQPTEVGQKQLCTECLEKGIEIEIHSISKSFYDKNKGMNSTYLVWVNPDNNTHRKKTGDTYTHITDIGKKIEEDSQDGNGTKWYKQASEMKAKYETATDQEKLFKKDTLESHKLIKKCAISTLLDEGLTMEQLEKRGDIIHARTKELALVDLTNAIREAISKQ